ncbi:hypothetical protein GOBAR_DD09011 [Gossypium barbadense]|nr:hypothetical protein GOBAR_DD09011 [Gossypium barbadense]
MNAELYSHDSESFRVQEYIDHRSGLSLRSYTVDQRNRRCECGKFQSLRYLCVHVHVVCAKGNLNKVPPPIFEVLPDCSLHRHPKGQLHMMRIRDDIDVRETNKPKHCGVCRTSVHNRSTCPHCVYCAGQCAGQSFRNIGLEYDE